MAKPSRSPDQATSHQPASPTRPPACNIKIEHNGRTCVVNYATRSATRIVFDHITSQSAIHKYLSPKRATLDNGAVIQTDYEIDDIAEWPLPTSDAPFDLEYHDPQSYKAIQTVLAIKNERTLPEATPSHTRSQTSNETPCTPVEQRSKPAREPRPPRHNRTIVAAKQDGVPLSKIAADAGIEPTVARKKLRAANEPKPANGWHFDSTDVDRIIEIITRE